MGDPCLPSRLARATGLQPLGGQVTSYICSWAGQSTAFFAVPQEIIYSTHEKYNRTLPKYLLVQLDVDMLAMASVALLFPARPSTARVGPALNYDASRDGRWEVGGNGWTGRGGRGGREVVGGKGRRGEAE